MHRNALTLTLLAAALPALAAEPDEGFSVFGTLKLDVMHNTDAADPAWDDMFRIRKIATRGAPYGDGSDTAATARFSFIGARYRRETELGPLTLFGKFDLTGMGEHAGETRPRINRLYLEWGRIQLGKNDSLFRDASTYPDTLEWYGPVGLAGGVPYHIHYTHPLPNGHWAIGLEDVVEAIDPVLINRIGGQELYDPGEQQDAPDLTAHYRRNSDRGHVQISGVLRKVTASGKSGPDTEFKVTDTGWGINLSGSRRFDERNTLRAAVAGGHGIAGYMNEGGADMVIANNRDPDTATAQDSHGWSAYLEHAWNAKLVSAVGASGYSVANEDFEDGTAFRRGLYASANLLYRPDRANTLGAELLWGRREDKDGQAGNTASLQLSYRFSFDSAGP